MKIFFTLVVISLVASALSYGWDYVDNHEVYYDECLKKEHISQEDALKLKQGNFANPSKSLQCFGVCVFEKAGALKGNEINDAFAIKTLGALIGEAKAKAALDKCRHIKGEDRCNTFFKVFKCLETEKIKLAAA